MRLCYAMAENVETRFFLPDRQNLRHLPLCALTAHQNRVIIQIKEGKRQTSLPESYYEITATSLRHGAVISFY